MEFFLFLLAASALGLAIGALRKAGEQESRVFHLRDEIERLHRHQLELKAELRRARVGGVPAEETGESVPPPIPIVESVERAPSVGPSVPPPIPPAIPPLAAPPPIPEPAARTGVPPIPGSSAAPFAAKEAAAPSVIPIDEGAPPPPVPPVPPLSAEAPAPPPPRRIDWESFVGVKLFSAVAGICVAIAGVYFAKYSVAQGWLTPEIRMVLGLLFGTGLLVLGELEVSRRYAITANALDAGGIVVLYATLFATHALWHLAGPVPIFAAMALVTAVAVALAIRRDSAFIAVLGLFGGFATPALLSTGQDRPIGLFGYLLLLNAGLAWVAHKKRWTYLSALCVVFTTLYQWAWVTTFLTAPKVPLAIGIFLVFPLLAVFSLAVGERGREEAKGGALFRRATAASAALPLLFGVYVAAVPEYGARWGILFGFLFALDLGLAAVGATIGPEILHVLGGVTTLLVFAVWLGMSYRTEAWRAILGIVTAFVLLYLFAPVAFRRLGKPFGETGRRALFTAPLLVFVFPVLAAIEKETAGPGALFGVLFALLVVLGAYSVFYEEGAVHFLAAFFALAAEAIWSAKHLDADRLLPALTLYGVFALFYLGVPMAARRLGKTLRPSGSGAILLFVSLGLLFFLAAGPVAAAALWGLALLLAILNLGLLFEASSGHHPILALLGMILSWIVIAVWWASATLTALLVPGLVVVAGFAVLVLGGNLWAKRQAKDTRSPLDPGVYLGLVGHLFLLFVVSQKSLATRTAPILGVLLVQDLAIGVAALWARKGALHVAALVASQVVLLGLELTLPEAPHPEIAVLSAGGVAAFGLVWAFLSRRFESGGERPLLATLAGGAAAALFLAQLVGIAASDLAGFPSFAFLVTAHGVFLAALLALAGAMAWHRLAVFAVIPAAAAVLVWRESDGRAALFVEELVFVAVLYALFIAYPLVLGTRVKGTFAPHLAAVVASGVFFLQFRQALLAAGFHEMGALPIAQAALLALLLWRLLKLDPSEPRDERDTARLALVAGAALSFVTIAIPLQLEKQWVTIGWALQAAVLAWLFTRIRHVGLLVFVTGLSAAVFVRLVFNRAVFEYHPRGALPVLNWYLYTYLVSAAALFLAARLLRGRVPPDSPLVHLRVLLPSAATVLLFLLLNIEIADFYSTGPTLTFNFTSASLAQDLTYTIFWALFAIGLLVAGLVSRNRPVRLTALVLLVVTILKCFLHDLGRLGGLYRVGSFVGLALCLSAVAVLIQKFVLKQEERVP